MSLSKPFAINDLFWTLQGEGRWSGYRALFIRLPFCNFDCPWCDTEYQSFKNWEIKDFENFCQKEPSRFAVLTGGEPLIHKDVSRIITQLKRLGFRIACETNGSAPIPEGIDFVTVSPKRYTKSKYPPFYIHEDALVKANEFKYVVDESFDFKNLDRHKNAPPETTCSLSPEFSKMAEMTEKIIAYIKGNPKWRLNLQTHKWIHIP